MYLRILSDFCNASELLWPFPVASASCQAWETTLNSHAGLVWWIHPRPSIPPLKWGMGWVVTFCFALLKLWLPCLSCVFLPILLYAPADRHCTCVWEKPPPVHLPISDSFLWKPKAATFLIYFHRALIVSCGSSGSHSPFLKACLEERTKRRQKQRLP